MSQLELRKRLENLYRAGITSPTILQTKTGMSRAGIYKIISKIKSGISLEIQPGRGRRPICDSNDKRRLVQIALKNPAKSGKYVQDRARDLGGPAISVRTVQRQLKASGVLKLKPKPCIDLTDAQTQKRLLLADQHLNDDWTSTIFTDESSFCLNRMQCSLWSPGRRRQIPRSKFPKNLMIWGGISTLGQTTLAVVRGSINSNRYIEILQEHLLPSAISLYGDAWRLQQDNATPHVSKSTRNWLAENVPQVLVWPANSPDLSPIENIWQIVKNAVEKNGTKNLPEFEQKIVQTWTELDVGMLSRLIDSMPRRLKLCRDLRGNEIDLKLI